MIGKSYGYVIFDNGCCVIASDKENVIAYIQNRLLENSHRIAFVKSCIIDEGYPKANYSDDFMKNFIRDKLIQEPYYFDCYIYYTEAPFIEN